MKVLVTGATGFVGSHLIERLTSEGHEVFSLVRNLEKAKEFKIKGQLIKGELSISSNNSWISQLPDSLNTVVHTAGIVHSFNSSDFENINTKATKTLFEDIKSRYKKIHFLFISSQAAVGPSHRGQAKTEDSLLSPVSKYGESKKKAEELLESSLPEDFSLTIIRPPMILGPRDPAILDVFKMVNSRIFLASGLKGMRNEYSFVCIFDLIEKIYKALEKETKSVRIFHSAYPQSIEMRDLLSEIESVVKKKAILLTLPLFLITLLTHLITFLRRIFPIELRLTPDKLNELRPNSWLISSEASRKELSMSYKWNLKDSIKITYEDYCFRDWL